MKSLIIIIVLFSLGLKIYPQSWRIVDQSDYNMKYKLPKSWNVDGFGASDDWGAYGSSVCHCSGTINFSDIDSMRVGMVVYPCLKEDVNSEKRQKVWNYEFIKQGDFDTIKTKKLTFIRQKSDFGNEDDYYNSKDYEAWQLIAYNGKFAFVIYFWGRNESMKREEKTIIKILESFIGIKK